MSNSPITPQQDESEKMVLMGELGAPFGLLGLQKVHSYTQPLDNIFNYPSWYIWRNKEWVLKKVLSHRRHGLGWLVQLEGNTVPEEAALWVKCKIAIPREELPSLEENEFYWSDLEGLVVKDKQLNDIGKILYLYDNAGTDTVGVQVKGKEHQLPFILHDTVVSVNLEQGYIVLDWDFNL